MTTSLKDLFVLLSLIMSVTSELTEVGVKTSGKCVESDMFCRTPDLLVKYGYPVEIHKILTKDGFILEGHRIPYGSIRSKHEGGKKCSSRKPVLLAHALLCSSSDWLMNLPEKALGYKLADSGYDVWLINSRGNSYSNGHVNFTDQDWQFWDFSFHEMGTIDIPAWIDYILTVTRHEDLFYVGHSMGSTEFMIAMSERPEYNSKIRIMFALAPAIFITDSTYWMFAKLSTLYDQIINMVGPSRFLPETFRTWLNILGYGCQSVEPLCDNFFFFVAGYNPGQMNSSQTSIIASHSPDSVSSMTINHFLQIMRWDRFQKYDYGSRNMEIYNETAPPAYPLERVTAPVVYFHSTNDVFATPNDIQKSVKLLANLKEVNLVEDPLFTHVDFTYAKDADKLVYQRILEIMLESEKKDAC